MLTSKSMLIPVFLVTIWLMPVGNCADDKLSINEIIERANQTGLAMFYDPDDHHRAIIFDPLVNALSSLSEIASIKLGLVYATVIWGVNTYFPNLVQRFGLTPSENSTEARMNLRELNLHEVYLLGQRLVTRALDHVLGYLNVHEPGCRYRAVCEASNYMTRNMPMVNGIMKRMSGIFYLNLANPYSLSWLNGMVMKNDCAVLYDNCPESPFRSLINRLSLQLRR